MDGRQHHDPGEGQESPTQVHYDNEGQAVLVLRAATLRVVSGPDDGACVALDLRRMRVGTAADNDLVLTDPSVSRHHLEFQVRDQGYQVRDLDSTNGSFFRGARISEAHLGAGAELRLGDSVLRIERGEECSRVVKARKTFGTIIGNCRPMQEVFGLLAAVAPTDTTVLINGETGTGKELVAEELHRQSARRGREFVVVDCGAIPAQLIESELFGHVKGAFTGAVNSRPGAFENSSGGTVFLDEIGELPLEMQTRLLRVLDKRTIKRVGSHDQRPVDIRVVAATNRDLPEMIQEGAFRQDLYYRLSVVQIQLPPLRQRRPDIPLLARHFLWQSGCPNPEQVLGPEVLEALSTRQWPGNVRELRNVIERAAILADGSPLAAGGEQAPAAATQDAAPSDRWLSGALSDEVLNQPYKVAKEQLLHEFELLYLGRLVERHGPNISRVAADADVDRHLVRKLLRKHDMIGQK